MHIFIYISPLISVFVIVSSMLSVLRLWQVWPHADYPLIPVGRFTLNRNPSNYHLEVEQSAFSPSNFVPGLCSSPTFES